MDDTHSDDDGRHVMDKQNDFVGWVHWPKGTIIEQTFKGILSLTYSWHHSPDKVKGTGEIPPRSFALDDPRRGRLRVNLQEHIQLRLIDDVVLQERFQNVLVGVAVFHFPVALQEHEDGGTEEHVKSHDDHE